MSVFDAFRDKPDTDRRDPEAETHDSGSTGQGNAQFSEDPLDLDECKRLLNEAARDAERLRRDVGIAAEQARTETLSAFVSAIAAPVSHLAGLSASPLRLDRDLRLEALDRAVNRLLDALIDEGVDIGPPVGEVVSFDPSRHRVSGPTDLPVGSSVEVQSPAVVLASGRIIRKAGVQPV